VPTRPFVKARLYLRHSGYKSLHYRTVPPRPGNGPVKFPGIRHDFFGAIVRDRQWVLPVVLRPPKRSDDAWPIAKLQGTPARLTGTSRAEPIRAELGYPPARCGTAEAGDAAGSCLVGAIGKTRGYCGLGATGATGATGGLHIETSVGAYAGATVGA
jgi:hypothetical protein